VSCGVKDAVPVSLSFESRLVREAMPAPVLRQVLAQAHRQGRPHPLFRYYMPTVRATILHALYLG
jgi:hypothetical protein